MDKYTPKRAAKGEAKLFSFPRHAKRQKHETEETIRLDAVQEEGLHSPSLAPNRTDVAEETEEWLPSSPEDTGADMPDVEEEAEPHQEPPQTSPVEEETTAAEEQEKQPGEAEKSAELGEEVATDPAAGISQEDMKSEEACSVGNQMLSGDPPVPSADPVEKSAGKRKKKHVVLFVILGFVLVMVLGYAILCASVDGERALLKTTVNGVDVSGMTQEQIVEVIDANNQSVYGDETVSVQANGETYTVEVGPTLTMDAQSMAEEILTRSQSFFWKRGYYFIENAIRGDERSMLPTVTDEEGLNQAIEDSGLMKIDTTVQTTYEVTHDALVFTMGKTGHSVDKEGLVKSIKAAVAANDYETPIESPMLTGTVQPMDVEKIHQEIYQEKVNATLDPDNNYEVVPSVEGVDFDLDAAIKTLDAAEEGSEVSIKLIRTEPTVTTEKLKNNLFRDVLGECTTTATGTANRLTNVRLAAEKIDGYIMLPGDEFSYNGVVGERTAANGFKTAGAYLNGETVQEYGGGICQVSSTAYLASLRANLEITERHNHTYVSSYIDKGMDATVSWGGPDLRFKNDQDYPIKIVTSFNSSNQITVQILGTNVDGISVKITNEILTWNDYDTEYRNDNSMYEGESYKAVSGEPGGTVQTYRNIYDRDGNLISSEKEAYSSYTRRDAVVYVGTKKKAATKSKTATAKTATTTGAQG